MAQALPRVLAISLSLGIVTNAGADSWSLPEETTHLSSDGQWRFTVTPRALSGQRDYFQDAMDGKEKAGALQGGNDAARGRLEQRTDNGWATVWSKELLNDVAPVDVLVTTNGQVATLDNWHMIGQGENVVVLYDRSGASVCSLTLDDLFPAVVVDHFPHSVSSIGWRGKPRLSQSERMLSLTIASPTPYREKNGVLDMLGETFELGLRMNDCSVSPPAREVWHAVLAVAKQSGSEAEKQQAEWRAKFVAPLTAPHAGDVQAWDTYLMLAWFRSSPEADRYSARTQYLAPRERPGHEASIRQLRKELERLTEWSDTLVAGSASPSELVEILREFAAAISRDALRSKRLALALGSTDFATARGILLPTGATLIHIDPTAPLPQSEENLRWLENSEQAEVEEVTRREKRMRDRPAWWKGY